MNINAPSQYKIVLRAKSGKCQSVAISLHNNRICFFIGGFTSDSIAVDDLSVQDKACDTSYYQINEYDVYLQNTSKGEYYRSPVMYTDDGYAYNLKV